MHKLFFIKGIDCVYLLFLDIGFGISSFHLAPPLIHMLEEALKKNHLSLQEAVRLGIELAESCRGRGNARLRRCREIIRAGAEACRQSRLSICFSHALQKMMHLKSDRRNRTLSEIKSITKRILRMEPSIAASKLTTLQHYPWQNTIQRIFPTRRQQNKARVILHGVFDLGIQQGWCSFNPMKRVTVQRHQETEILPLSIEKVQTLLRTAQQPRHRPCMAALGIMLWAGVRPAEVERLSYEDIDFKEKIISLRPTHSKTGGCRHIPMAPVLQAWLTNCQQGSRICPANWPRRWKALRQAAGIIPWQQDVLRHTFASYHLKKYQNLTLLQVSMGHRSAHLLQTRYLNMRGLTHASAQRFWSKKLWSINS